MIDNVKITRFIPYMNTHDVGMRPVDDGEWVRYSEAAQAITALRAERDYAVSEMKEAQEYMRIETAHAEAAEEKVKKLEAELERKHQNPTDYRYWEGRWRDTQAECDTAIRERDKALSSLYHARTSWGYHDHRANTAEAKVKELEQHIAFDTRPRHLEINALKLRCDNAIRERDEAIELIAKTNDGVMKIIRERDQALKALEPFAKQAARYDPPEDDDNHPLWGVHTLTIGDVRRARSASSNREGGEE